VLAACLPPIAPGKQPEAFAEELKHAIESATTALIAESFARHPELREAVMREDSVPHTSPAPVERRAGENTGTLGS
jgi:hypothetical protein